MFMAGHAQCHVYFMMLKNDSHGENSVMSRRDDGYIEERFFDCAIRLLRGGEGEEKSVGLLRSVSRRDEPRIATGLQLVVPFQTLRQFCGGKFQVDYSPRLAHDACWGGVKKKRTHK